ncbi:hypothetical protein P154DRAFT_581367 [Amniculicola lignicola CBS 123094]|uniref:Uncharacterized protein n=1 Tax=Amniculicola lignicola CBS 123094 TaxID=1392246 RepID=A0A6A5W0X4_9PLEO|nr:hypothetical protein P154DRAFT_581367 [Amniculicola lignicola CBS 123094]
MSMIEDVETTDGLTTVLEWYRDEMKSANDMHECLAIVDYLHRCFETARSWYMDYCKETKDQRLRERLGDSLPGFNDPCVTIHHVASYLLVKIFLDVGGNWGMIGYNFDPFLGVKSFVKGVNICHPSFLWEELSGKRYTRLFEKISTINDAATQADELMKEVAQAERQTESLARVLRSTSG